MALSLRRWKPKHLLMSWAAYWVGVIAVKLGPAIAESWRVTQLPKGHGSINASYANGLINYSIVEDGVNTFVASTSFSTVLLWALVPPLALWLIWLFVRVRPATPSLGAREQAVLSKGTAPAEEWHAKDDRVPVERVHTPNP
jgi:hypothetical protein